VVRLLHFSFHGRHRREEKPNVAWISVLLLLAAATGLVALLLIRRESRKHLRKAARAPTSTIPGISILKPASVLHGSG
jgi:hypothetical protein